MAQIANQDNLIIEISGALSAMDGTTKAKLVECVKGGTIFDVILKSVEAANNVNYGKVVGVKIDNTTGKIVEGSWAYDVNVYANGIKVSIVSVNNLKGIVAFSYTAKG